MLNKSVLEFTYETTEPTDDVDDIFVTGQITSTTQLTFSRKDTGGTVTVRWFVWEAKPGTPMTVQRGSVQTGMSASKPVNVPISAVNTAKAFPIISTRIDGTTANPEYANRAKITSSVNLEIDADGTTADDMEVEWQVVENTDWDVQQFDVSLAGTTVSQAVTAVPLADSYLAASGEFSSTLTGSRTPYIENNTTTSVFFSRTSSTGTWIISLYLIDTKGDFSTQHVQNVIPANQEGHTETLTMINMDRAFIKTGTPLNHCYHNFDGADIDGDDACCRSFFSSSTQVRTERDNANPELTNYGLIVCEVN